MGGGYSRMYHYLHEFSVVFCVANEDFGFWSFPDLFFKYFQSVVT